MYSYKTIKIENSDEFVEKKSRFIGYAKPVVTEDEAIEFIKKIRAKHPDATHNVYAYKVRENNIQRYSDDGEPAGTAGIPTLDVIQKEGITDICVVVTRYFGGILLGTGGLVKAYSQSTAMAYNGAVSARKMRLPSVTAVAPLSTNNWLSSGAKPPSLPTIKAIFLALSAAVERATSCAFS